MSDTKHNIDLTKEDVIALMIDSFKAGNTSYMDLAEDFCCELLNDFVLKKAQIAAQITAKIPQDKPAPKPFADFGNTIAQTSTIFLSTSPPTSSSGTFLNISSSSENNSFSSFNSLDFGATNYYNNNNT